MKKTSLTKEEVDEIVEVHIKEKLNKTKLQLPFMDSYVAFYHPDKVEEWVDECLALGRVDRKVGGKDTKIKDVVGVRKLFLKKFFPDYTDEAINARKEEERARKQAKKAEKDADSKLSDRERLIKNIKKISDSQ